MLRVRTGSIPGPVITWLCLRDGGLRVTGDAASGRPGSIRGYPKSTPGTGIQKPEGEQAVDVWNSCGGGSFLRGAPVLDHLSSGFKETWPDHALGTPNWNGSGWDISVASPYLMPDGSVTRGSCLTLVACTSLQRLGSTPKQATSGEMTVTRTDNGLVSAAVTYAGRQPGIPGWRLARSRYGMGVDATSSTQAVRGSPASKSPA